MVEPIPEVGVKAGVCVKGIIVAVDVGGFTVTEGVTVGVFIAGGLQPHAAKERQIKTMIPIPKRIRRRLIPIFD